MTPESELQHHPRPKPRTADRKNEDITNNKSPGHGALPKLGNCLKGKDEKRALIKLRRNTKIAFV